MGATARTNPYPANAFYNNPPTGAIVPIENTIAFTGYIATPGSFGFSVQCFEVAGRAYLVFNRMYGALLSISMDFSCSDGTAINGVDYTAVSGTVTWGAFDITAKVVQVPLKVTTKITSSFFTFNVLGVYITGSFFHSGVYIFKGGNINPFPGPDFATSYSFPVTIVRPTNGEADFVGTPYSITRPGGTTTLTVQVQRFNGFRGAQTVNYHTTDGTALAGTAYTAASGTLSWADGEGGTKNIVITILSGGSGTQNFTVTIDTPVGGIVIGPTNIATVNIVAAAPPPNPVAGGSIPQQLTDEMDVYNDTFRIPNTILSDDLIGFFRPNVLYSGMLSQKIGSVIGFGGGNDPTDGPTTLVPPFGRFKYQGYAN